SRRLRASNGIFSVARHGNNDGAQRIWKAARTRTGSARLAVHGGGHHGAGLLALSSLVRAACDNSVHASDPRAMTNSLAERFFDYDLWLVGAAHFVILIASFQVPYRLNWKADLQQLTPF